MASEWLMLLKGGPGLRKVQALLGCWDKQCLQGILLHCDSLEETVNLRCLSC